MFLGTTFRTLFVHANSHNVKRNSVPEQRVRLTQIDSPVQIAVDQKKSWSVLLPVLYLPHRVQFPKDLDESVKKLRAYCECGMSAANSCAIAKLLQEILDLSSFVDRFLFISGKQRSNGGGKGDAWWVWLTVRGRRRSCEGLVREMGVCFGESGRQMGEKVWGHRDIPTELYLRHRRRS
jgi:hypothetical protein